MPLFPTKKQPSSVRTPEKEERIFAVESSCDDTSVALMEGGRLIGQRISSQEEHAAYGGVVPEVASRAHQRHIVALSEGLMQSAGWTPASLDALAYTRGPGLLGSLLVGVSFGKGMALALGKPLIDVDHLEAHVLSHFIEAPRPDFPFLCLLVSGGHTQLVRVDAPLRHHILGRSIDDAAGEAFDKGAKMLGLPYPGGPQIDRLARRGDPGRFRFSRASMPGLDFSFSGLKTSLLYFLRDAVAQNPAFIGEHLADLCAAYQEAVVDSLLEKVTQAAQQTAISRIGLAGGVAANTRLRQRLESLAQNHGWEVYVPQLRYCIDNAAMIAMAAHFHWREGRFGRQTDAPFARRSS
jgi:N6-L-threonylcarbamoyladenine synthase